MTIGAVGGFYNFHQVSNIPKVDLDVVRKQDALLPQQTKEFDQTAVSQEVQEAPEAVKRQTQSPLEDISLRFNQGETYDYIGKDSALENLDVQRAVSDMQKDQILQQYQYFVGSQELEAMVLNNSDGVVLQK